MRLYYERGLNMTKVTLMIDKEVDGKTYTDEVEYNIKKVNFLKFADVTKLITEIIEIVKNDKRLTEVFSKLFVAQQIGEEENMTAEDRAARDQEFFGKIVHCFETLAFEIPKKALELLALLSGIDKENLGEQDFFVFMDVYDAVLEENDIPKLIERVKKSLGLTKNVLKLKQLVQNVNQ